MPYKSYRRKEGPTYALQVTIAGYGLRATGRASYLAITVLLVYLLLVVLHTSYVLYLKDDSSSWSSLTDMFVLSQTSPPLLTL